MRRSYALHTEPAPEAFDAEPRAISWFVEMATDAVGPALEGGDDDAGDSARRAALRLLAADVVEVLARYGLATREVRRDDPGEITYADAVQVVAVPTGRPESTD